MDKIKPRCADCRFYKPPSDGGLGECNNPKMRNLPPAYKPTSLWPKVRPRTPPCIEFTPITT